MSKWTTALAVLVPAGLVVWFLARRSGVFGASSAPGRTLAFEPVAPRPGQTTTSIPIPSLPTPPPEHVDLQYAGHTERTRLRVFIYNDETRQLTITIPATAPLGPAKVFASFGGEEWTADLLVQDNA